MNVLLLSLGGGGGNILRSLKTILHRDLTVMERTDAAYADRLRRRIAARFLDTNEFSLSDAPPEERLLIGAATTKRLGSRHDPELARAALIESQKEVEALLRGHSTVILIGTGGKGTGAGTMFPVAEMARALKMLVIPVFVRPSFDRHEVDKRRYDHALRVLDQFDAARIRVIEILNDRGYTDADPAPQSIVWERMNLPIARGLRGLLYVLEDLSQVDPSDLSALFAGSGRLRLGFAEIDPPAGQDPSDEQIDEAARRCWQIPYDAFNARAGTSLICIQGLWSNVVDAKIKGRLGYLASAGAADSPYTPLYARAIHTPKPWGVTALFAEHTGTHPPLEIAWTIDQQAPKPTPVLVGAGEVDAPPAADRPPEPIELPRLEPAPAASADATAGFKSFWAFALALNRGDAAALALAGDGSTTEIPIDGVELRKLLPTVWFRSVFSLLSHRWRDRLFATLLESVPLRNHAIRCGRRDVPIEEASYAQLREAATRTDLPDAVRSDVQVLIAVGRLWGEEAVRQCRFVGDSTPAAPRVSVMHALRAASTDGRGRGPA
jgi:cell division GTPase FtsZ